MKRLLIIDNYDSFTWNLYQYFCKLGANVFVYKNDLLSINDIKYLNLTHLVISPGPGNPDHSGISLSAIKYFANKLPILGVCLGHQVIGQFFGGKIVKAKNVLHGKLSIINHCNKSIFFNIKQPLRVALYNSLIIDYNSFPSCLEIIAWKNFDNKNYKYEIMAIKHKQFPILGVQFHPESIISEYGYNLLYNFLNLKI